MSVPPRVEPMLASPSTSQGGRVPVQLDSLGEGWVFQEKIDGVRAQVRWDGSAILITGRSGNDLTVQFMGIGSALGVWFGGVPLSLDGEITIPGQGLDEVLSRVKSGRPKISDDARFTAFDVLSVGKDDLIADRSPLSERLRALDDLMLPVDSSTLHRVEESFHADTAWSRVQDQQLEGLVAKRLDSRYLPGRRGWSWVKFKHTYTVLCIVSGKSGERGNGVTLHMVGNGSQLVPVGSVGAGLTAQHLATVDAALNVHGFPVAIVECLGISSGNKLRMPVFKGFHPDPNLLLASVDQLAELPVTT